eukprot:gb/GFBE01032886.1/.p1 GENE.gb/GFBE01032886.1/~~gb/GFBE01032886.1/.p1  ORF type:complete len:723 (+),score=308.40 gb/GFBE01032886.1/:1-2169(+)
MAVRSILLLIAASLLGSQATSPAKKVIEMLEGLKKEVEEEGAQEAKSFGTYQKFCADTQEEKEGAIKVGEDKEEEAEATITATSASYDETLSDIQDRKAKQQQLAKEQQDGDAQCTEDKATFEANNADLGEAVVALEAAIGKLDAAQSTKTKEAAMLQFGSGVQKSLKLAAAMGFLQEPKQKALQVLLQEDPWNKDEGAEYNKENYEFQSSGIVSTLQELLGNFRTERTNLQTEFEQTKKACDNSKEAKAAEIKENDDAINSAELTASAMKGEVAAAKESLLATQASLKDDRAYLEQLKESCNGKAADFDQRSKGREDEIKAIGSALEVLSKTLEAPATKEEDAAAPTKELGFMQLASETSGSSNAVGTDASRAQVSANVRLHAALQHEALETLAAAGRRLRSARVSGLAAQLRRMEQSTGEDPLVAVKQMVFDLVTKLQKEAAEEATQQGFCAAEMAKANRERDRRLREAKQLNAKLQSLDTKHTELLEEIDLLGGEISKLEASLLEATSLRTAEAEANAKGLKEAKDGSEAVKSAITALSDFYKSADRKAKKYDAVFLQTRASVQEEPDAGFDGSYGGKQTAAQGIISMMEVVQSDFKRAVEETEAAEEKAEEEFTKLKQDSKADIAGKSTTKKLDEEEVEVTLNDMKSSKAELTATMDLLDGALRTLEDLKPQCADNAMSYEERKAKREQELASLKTALCTMDTKGVEPECQGEVKTQG